MKSESHSPKVWILGRNWFATFTKSRSIQINDEQMTGDGEVSTRWQAGINRQTLQLLDKLMLITRAEILISLDFNLKIIQM
jgi:hypothetical protein